MADCRDLDKRSLRPGWPAEVASGLGLRRLGHEVPEPDEVVGGGGQIGPELVALDPDVTQLATPADHLQPAEDLLHPLTNTLAGGVAEMSDGAAVDPAAALGIDVLGDVGRDLESAAAGDKVAGVVVLIGTQREPALAMPPAQVVERLEPCLAFGGSCRLGKQDVDRQAVSVLHQKVTGEVELGFPAFALTRQPGLLVGAGDVSVVGTLLAVEVDLNIAAAGLAWGPPPRVALGRAPAGQGGGARLEGPDRGPALLGIHLVEDRAQVRERRLYKRLHAPNRVVGGDELISGDREEGHLAGGAAAHAASWKTWAVTKRETSCWQLTASRARAHAREAISSAC